MKQVRREAGGRYKPSARIRILVVELDGGKRAYKAKLRMSVRPAVYCIRDAMLSASIYLRRGLVRGGGMPDGM